MSVQDASGRKEIVTLKRFMKRECRKKSKTMRTIGGKKLLFKEA